MLIKGSKRINCLDLKGQHQQVKKEVFEAFEKVYEATAFSGGTFVEEFENSFAKYNKSNYAVGVNNGTSALHLAMLALGIKQGDEVIIPSNTFIATAWGVTYTGGTPIFVDCDPNTWEIDATKIEAKITSKTKAIIGVHLYGMPFDIDAVKAICDRLYFLLKMQHRLKVQHTIILWLEALEKWLVLVFIRVKILEPVVKQAGSQPI
jgi:dTDP-4-amino-4,6-dideoxygalactose transaminase